MDKHKLYELEEVYDLITEEYACGMRSALAHIENLRSEMTRREERTPFENVIARIKCFDSAIEKCERRGLEPSEETFRGMHDIAGIRIIVPFLDDVKRVRDALCRRNSLKIEEEKDYIKNPKPNGYRSYHLIVKTRVCFFDEDRWLPVEIQIRTKAQDFWSSMEHKLRYKNAEPAPESATSFAAFAEQLFEKDLELIKLRDYNKIAATVADFTD